VRSFVSILFFRLTTLEYSSSLSLELVHLFSQNMSSVMGLSGGSSATGVYYCIMSV